MAQQMALQVCSEHSIQIRSYGSRAQTRHGYEVELTSAEASHQNGTVERNHCSIGNMIRSVLIGSNMEKTLWPFALYHSFFIMNRIDHEGKNAPPITLCSGTRCSLAGRRTFGCRVYVKLPRDRPAKLDTNHREGFFIGYANTMKNIHWYGPSTRQVKIATNFRFDHQTCTSCVTTNKIYRLIPTTTTPK
jgi:hypothetical protein